MTQFMTSNVVTIDTSQLKHLPLHESLMEVEVVCTQHVVQWHGKELFYDGLKGTKESRLVLTITTV